MVVLGSTAFLALAAALALARRRLLRGRSLREAATWDCGYVDPRPRMQYTASGFAQPLTSLFRFVLRTRREFSAPRGPFPKDSALSTRTPDLLRERAYEPLFAGIGRALSKPRRLQSGQLQLYVLYIAVTLLVLLIWKLAWP
jgi:hypothetical protein